MQSKNDRLRVESRVLPGTVAEAALGEEGFSVWPADDWQLGETKFPKDGTVVDLADHAWEDGGNSYVKSNYAVLLRDFADHPDVEFPGSSVRFRGESEDPALIGVVNSLAGYPILDEMHHSEMELEAQTKAVRDFYARELARQTKRDYREAFPDQPDLVDAIDEAIDLLLDSGAIEDNFHQIAEGSGVEWDGEEINIRRINATLISLIIPRTSAWLWFSSLVERVRARLAAAASLDYLGDDLSSASELHEEHIIPLLNVLYDQGYAQESEAHGYREADIAAAEMKQVGLGANTVERVIAHLSRSSAAEKEFAAVGRDAYKLMMIRPLLVNAEREGLGDEEELMEIATAVPEIIEIAERYPVTEVT